MNLIGAPYQIIIGKKSQGDLLEFQVTGEETQNLTLSKIIFDHDIGNMTWFKTGGKAKIFILVEDENELEIIINTFQGMNFFIMGSGSNTLIRDGGYNGIIIKFDKSFSHLSLFNEIFFLLTSNIVPTKYLTI